MSRIMKTKSATTAAMALLMSASFLTASAYEMNYEVSFEPETHYINVELTYSSDEINQPVLLKMPVWAPGYYLIVDYPKYLTDFKAEDASGQTLNWEKVGKNGWKFSPKSRQSRLSWRIFANERSVAESRVEENIGFLTPNGVFMHREGDINHDCHIHFTLPDSWSHISTGLAKEGTTPGCYYAKNFDLLYDSPFLFGNHYTEEFSHEGHTYEFALETPDGYKESPFKEDFKKMVSTTTKLIGDVPYDNYCLIHLGKGGGGLEHINSQACYSEGTFRFTSHDQYLRYMSFVTHEYFHLYNVKSIRPIELGPFDYDREVFTPLLWVSEGFTVYYETRLMMNAGICDSEYLLKDLSSYIETIEGKEGHKHMSLRQSSYDIWLNFFNRSKNGKDVRISYYDKGPIIGLLMDIEIRSRTNCQKSLDDLMRLLYWRYFKELKRGFTEEEFWQSVAETAGSQLDDIRRYVDTTEDIDYDGILAKAGLGINHDSYQLFRLKDCSKEAEKVRRSMGLEAR